MKPDIYGYLAYSQSLLEELIEENDPFFQAEILSEMKEVEDTILHITNLTKHQNGG